jgi:putative ABC transport system permease protein
MFTSLESANAYLTSGQTSSLSCKLPSGSTGLDLYQHLLKPPKTSTPSQPPPAPNKLVASDLITYVLIQAKPGQDLQVLKRKLEAALPNTRAYTRAELIEKNQTFWQRRTGIGFVLGLGAVVGIIVGVIIVGQILYSSVSDHLKEFGTLKAMGASDWVIYGVIIEQALWMAVLGYIPSMVLCYGVAAWTFASSGHPHFNHTSICDRCFWAYGYHVCWFSHLCHSESHPSRSSNGVQSMISYCRFLQ